MGKKIVGDIILVFVGVCDAVGSGGHTFSYSVSLGAAASDLNLYERDAIRRMESDMSPWVFGPWERG